jgi:hypothetical protein
MPPTLKSLFEKRKKEEYEYYEYLVSPKKNCLFLRMCTTLHEAHQMTIFLRLRAIGRTVLFLKRNTTSPCRPAGCLWGVDSVPEEFILSTTMLCFL